MKTTLKKLKFHIPVMIVIVLLAGIIGYYIGFEPSSTDGTVKKTDIANATKNDDSEVSSDYIDPKTIADKSVQIKQSDFNKVFPNKKTEDTAYKAFIPDKYLGILNEGDPKNADNHKKGDLYINIYAVPEVLERLRRGYSLEQGQDIDLTIQTYTEGKIGAVYAGENFKFYPNPIKLGPGLFAYFSQYDPPTAFVYDPKTKLYTVVTGKNEQIVLKAIRNLRFGTKN